MSWIQPIINLLKDIFQWWVFILPWEQGIRVRAGKHKKILISGYYWKFPFIDQVFVQSTRLRFSGLPMQTLTTKDGITITVTSSVGYVVDNIEKLYESISNPQSTLAAIVLGSVADYISTHELLECSPMEIKKHCTNQMQKIDYGIGQLQVILSGYAVVKTFRLLQDQSWFQSDEYKDKPTQ